MKTLARPCPSCPWRICQDARAIPNFDLVLAESLARTCPDASGFGPSWDASVFACHQSRCGHEIACAGWLAVVGSAHPGVRLAVMHGTLPATALRPGADWPALHSNYQQVLAKLRRTSTC